MKNARHDIVPEEVNFLSEGKKLVEEVPSGTRSRFSRAGSVEENL